MKSLVETSTYDSVAYETIAKAITFMRQNYLSQPDLATVAQHVHLSEFHFQRLFTLWAGISPKRFLQYLTVEYAKSKIAKTKSLLDLSVDIGLSSSGRLHDLFVKLEAMSPGEFKTRGAGLRIWYGIHETPFGKCLIATTSRGICNLHFLDAISEQTAVDALCLDWVNALVIRDQRATQQTTEEIFDPVAINNTPKVLFVKGTNFQIQVWRALLCVPFGGMTTYQGLAEAIGRPTAARAVGNALASNPVGYLIPCHRVIRESGELGGYRWGRERQIAIQGWEASRQTRRSLHQKTVNRCAICGDRHRKPARCSIVTPTCNAICAPAKNTSNHRDFCSIRSGSTFDGVCIYMVRLSITLLLHYLHFGHCSVASLNHLPIVQREKWAGSALYHIFKDLATI